MGFLKKAWSGIKTTWKNIWDGTTFLQNNLTQIIKVTEVIKKVANSSITDKVTDLIPGKIDDRIVSAIGKGASAVLPDLKDAAKINDCLDSEKDDKEKIDCIADRLKEVTKAERYDFLLNIAAAGVKKLLEDENGLSISDEKARRIAQGTYDQVKLAKKLKE